MRDKRPRTLCSSTTGSVKRFGTVVRMRHLLVSLPVDAGARRRGYCRGNQPSRCAAGQLESLLVVHLPSLVLQPGACCGSTEAANIGRVDRIFVAKRTRALSAEDPKAVIRRWMEAWNAQELDAAEELLAPEFVRHDANLPDVVGPQAERQYVADTLIAFPRPALRDRAADRRRRPGRCRYLVQGAHRGDFLGIPGTGRPVTIQAVENYRLAASWPSSGW